MSRRKPKPKVVVVLGGVRVPMAVKDIRYTELANAPPATLTVLEEDGRERTYSFTLRAEFLPRTL